MKSHRTEFTYIDKIDYSSMASRSPHVEEDLQQGGKKKKMTVISKALVASPKVAWFCLYIFVLSNCLFIFKAHLIAIYRLIVNYQEK